MRKVQILLLTICAWILVPNSVNAATAYARLSSLTTQLPPATGYALVKMDSVDEIKNMELDPQRERLIATEPGLYFIIVSGQAGSISRDAKGYVDIWFEKNGKPVVNSTGRLTLSSSETAPLTYQAVLSLQAGDTIATAYSASGPSLGFIFIQPANEPACASFFISIFKLDNL